MKVRLLWFSGGWFFGCALCAHTLSAVSPVPVDSLGTAVIVTHRHPEKVKAAAPFQKITAEDLLRQGITDTGDALRRLAGVNLRDYGGAGGLKTVSVRGMGSTHTTVCLDGVPVNDARQGQIDLNRYRLETLDGIALSVLDAERLLCPVRALSSSSVLNLTTTQPDTTGRPLHLGARLSQGSFGQWSPSAHVSARLSRRQWVQAGLFGTLAENDYPFIVENGTASSKQRRTNSRMRNFTADLSHVLFLNQNGKLETKVFFNHDRQQLPGQVKLYVYDNDERLTQQNLFLQSRWSQRFGKLEVFAAAKFDHSRSKYADVDAQYPGGVATEHYRRREWYGAAGVAYALLPWLRAAYSTDLSLASMQSNQQTDNHVSRTEWAQALSAEVKRGPFSLTLRGILKTYRNEADQRQAALNGSHADPSLTLSWTVVERPWRLMLRAGAKRSFRLPTFTESYYHHSGSQSLLPERVNQLNVGLTLDAHPTTWWTELRLTADGYANRVKNRIMSVPLNLYLWRTVNQGRADIRGTDFSLSSTWNPSKKHRLMLALNYSYIFSADKTDRSLDSYGKQAAYTPRHGGAASLAWENPVVNAVVHNSFASDRWSTSEHLTQTKLPAYCEWGFALYRSFRTGTVEWNVRADLLNAFNHHYEIIRRYPMPGRAYRLTLTLKW